MRRSRLRALLMLALALGAGTRATAQGALDDTTAWEPLGDARQKISALAFSGDRDAPSVVHPTGARLTPQHRASDPGTST